MWKHTRGGLLHEPVVGDVEVVCTSVAGYDAQVDRHLQVTLAAKVDALSAIAVPMLHSAYGIVDALVGVDPLVEEPVQVHLRAADHAGAEVLGIGVAHPPLVEVPLHGRQEQAIAKRVLQVVQHGGGLEVHMAVPPAEPFVVAELIAMHVDGRQFVTHGIALVGAVDLLFAHDLRSGVAPLISGVRLVVHESIPIDVLQGPRGEELCEALVQEGAIGLVVPHHAEEPVMAHFVREQAAVVRVATTVQGEHGILHAIACIGHDHLGVGVVAEVGAIAGDDACRIAGGVLPSGGVWFLHQGHAFDPFPLRFADAVGGVGREGEVVHVLGVELPNLPLAGFGSDGHGRRTVPRLVLEVGDVQRLSKVGGHHLGGVLEPAGGVEHIVVGQVQVHVEGAEVAIEFATQVLLGVPAEALVIHRDARVPVHTIVVFVSPAVEELHAPVDIIRPVGGEGDAEAGALTGCQCFAKPHVEDGVVLAAFQLGAVLLQRADACARISDLPTVGAP